MLRLKPAPTFAATVLIPDPSGPAMSLVAQFRHMRKSEWAAFSDGARDRSEFDTVKAFLVGWSDADEPFGDAALADLLDGYPGAGFALSQAYAKALFEGRQGN